MGFDNILESNGLGIAATGMIIVFVALTLISVFIALLPRVLHLLSFVLPPPPEPETRRSTSVEEELIAAVGFVLHQRKSRDG